MTALPTVTSIAFGTGLVAASGIYLILVVTLTTTRQWWPPGDKTWAYYLHWSLVAVFNVSILTVAVLDWNEWILPRPASLVVGVLLSGLGAAIFLRSANAMQSDEVRGVTGDLYTDGPYAYSRNPQYVGMLVGIVGFAVLVNSFFVAVLAAVHAGWVVLLPFAEEPHLHEEYGREYERYTDRVPRFVGRTTLRELAN
ncbi:hypothetical protein GJR96_05110 [Haloferax sp. MBLA0076]|uniref:Isoprenylcysteine carboxylmethyltransferase family protein n=1 Tax=Haloferax litoreum TaxID=2666140 RepID=A0A6A8GI00_9EURY|nr:MULTISPECIES: isoprenylcysteine carboxylmethyltransferase family protein [Haloferax]KAB1192855.1 isoprenylcysteine carboxylmethyltransferase family protein [Haloferax sp. CBA1148]MRX21340.1 hypothetical protein [Haloferax litoreum]